MAEQSMEAVNFNDYLQKFQYLNSMRSPKASKERLISARSIALSLIQCAPLHLDKGQRPGPYQAGASPR